jgi:cation/acetate symporter
MGWTGGYVILAMLLAPYLRKFGKFTVPDFIGDRFYSNSARRDCGGLPDRHLRDLRDRSDDRCRRGLLALPRSEQPATGIWIAAGIVFLYAVFGGMKGITYTQVAQYVVLIIAYTIPAVFISCS